MHPLVRRQLRKAGLPEAPAADDVRAFIAAVDEAYAGADADRRQLEHSLNLASDELFARNQTLEAQLEELRRLEREVARHAAALDKRNRDMALILDNVDQGFVTVGLDGALGEEASRTLLAWFGPPPAGARIWSYLAGPDAELASWIQFGFDNLTNPVMPLEVVIAQLPDRLDRGGRSYRVGYQPIGAPPAATLVVVTDVTAELARQRAEATQRELIAVVERAYRDRAGFVAFVREADTLVRVIVGIAALPLADLGRAVHTLKGSAALFGVVTVADACHALEDQLAQGEARPTSAALVELGERWREFHDRIDRLLGLSARRTILVDWDEYQAVIAQLVEPEPAWAQRLRRWGQDPTRPHLERLAEEARTLGGELGKAPIDVVLRDHELRIDSERFAPVWAAVVHAVRNAVDHGVETEAARRAAGKPPRAKMTLTTEVHGDELVIEIADDGAGVDWDAVARRAVRLGLPTGTRHELVEALFADGISTAAAVTRISGRGIGMSALRATCVELGGRVQLLSERGAGTTLRCCVPVRGPEGAAPRRADRRTIGGWAMLGRS